jgi:hypothetical protein
VFEMLDIWANDDLALGVDADIFMGESRHMSQALGCVKCIRQIFPIDLL